jgi:hypothetical protein
LRARAVRQLHSGVPQEEIPGEARAVEAAAGCATPAVALAARLQRFADQIILVDFLSDRPDDPVRGGPVGPGIDGIRGG